jgi:hypothetical protein
MSQSLYITNKKTKATYKADPGFRVTVDKASQGKFKSAGLSLKHEQGTSIITVSSNGTTRSGSYKLLAQSDRWSSPVKMTLKVSVKNKQAPAIKKIIPQRTKIALNATGDTIPELVIPVAANDGRNFAGERFDDIEDDVIDDGVKISVSFNSTESALHVRTISRPESICNSITKKYQQIKLSYTTDSGKTITSKIKINYLTKLSKALKNVKRGEINTVARSTSCVRITPSVLYDKTVSINSIEIEDGTARDGKGTSYRDAFYIERESTDTWKIRAHVHKGGVSANELSYLKVSDGVYKPVLKYAMSDGTVIRQPVNIRVVYKPASFTMNTSLVNLHRSGASEIELKIMKNSGFSADDSVIESLTMDDKQLLVKDNKYRITAADAFTCEWHGNDTVTLKLRSSMGDYAASRLAAPVTVKFNAKLAGVNPNDSKQKTRTISVKVSVH